MVANGDAVVLGQVGSIQIHTVPDFGTKQAQYPWEERGATQVVQEVRHGHRLVHIGDGLAGPYERCPHGVCGGLVTTERDPLQEQHKSYATCAI